MARSQKRIAIRDPRTIDAAIMAFGYYKDAVERRLTFRGGLPGDKTELRRVKSLLRQAVKINREFERNNKR